ncbi:hypothetical protein VNO78_22090 [Psophocarpus tetragonolobus]|uniref:Uncharacterized protein n=1 Tax=Psophocarpus tetragonolobus TaxID=3891 RepID=A0AAN9XI50_PSOTE
MQGKKANGVSHFVAERNKWFKRSEAKDARSVLVLRVKSVYARATARAVIGLRVARTSACESARLALTHSASVTPCLTADEDNWKYLC